MKLFGVTDVGRHRKDNQDSFVFRELDGAALLLVCDGMGGAQAGSVASSVAVETFSAFVEERFAQGPRDDPEWWEDTLAEACAQANQKVFELAQANPEYRGMGTTLVAALALPGESYVVNVGDSRCYLLENGMIRQVTVDHSLVQLLVDRGEITAEEARRHPQKNLITRALGAEPVLMADCFRQALEEGDYLLLCSDGLSNVVNEQEMLYEVIHGGEDEACCQRLLDIALSRGAPDNVTVVLVKR